MSGQAGAGAGAGVGPGRVGVGAGFPPTTVPLRISIVALVMVREKFPLRLIGVVPSANDRTDATNRPDATDGAAGILHRPAHR